VDVSPDAWKYTKPVLRERVCRKQFGGFAGANLLSVNRPAVMAADNTSAQRFGKPQSWPFSGATCISRDESSKPHASSNSAQCPRSISRSHFRALAKRAAR
jgi:hypothetical protein